MSEYPRWSTSLVTAPAFEPISLTEAKLHCRVDHASDDPVFSALIIAARQYVENRTERKFATQTWDLFLDAFPSGDILLPVAPVSAITHVKYYDSDGTLQTWSTDEWDADLPSGPTAQLGRIYRAYGYSYPSARSIPNAVQVRFVAGYGGTSKTVSGITRASTTATATTSAAHGYATGNRVTIAGSDQADYNGTFEITVTGAATFTFTVANSPTTPATGPMTVANLGVPEPILAAQKLLIGHWYLNREAVTPQGALHQAPMAVDALLAPYKAY